MDSLRLVTQPVHAYDLGAGVGRHTLPIVAGLPKDSRVTAVDLIPSALASLVENAAAAGLANHVETVNADLESWEHVSSLDAFGAILERCRAATIPGGRRTARTAIHADQVRCSGPALRIPVKSVRNPR